MDFIDFYRSSLFLSPEEEDGNHDATKAKAGEDDRSEDFLRSSHTMVFQLGAVYHLKSPYISCANYANKYSSLALHCIGLIQIKNSGDLNINLFGYFQCTLLEIWF